MERSVIEGEEWRPVGGRIQGAPYEVSSLGRFWSVPRVISTAKGPRAIGGMVMKTKLAHDGYVLAGFKIASSQKWIMAHKVVTENFLGLCPSGMQVNHKDGDKRNNCLDNLEYVTPKENIRHANAMGLRSNNGWVPGNAHSRAKLTENDIRAIRSIRSRFGISFSKLGKMFMVHSSNINQIVKRITWSHI